MDVVATCWRDLKEGFGWFCTCEAVVEIVQETLLTNQLRQLFPNDQSLAFVLCSCRRKGFREKPDGRSGTDVEMAAGKVLR